MHSGVHREINTGKTQAAMHLNYAVHRCTAKKRRTAITPPNARQRDTHDKAATERTAKRETSARLCRA
jgi:hypothetical protein